MESFSPELQIKENLLEHRSSITTTTRTSLRTWPPIWIALSITKKWWEIMLPVLKPLPKTFGPKTAPSPIDLWPVFVSSLETFESSIFRHVKFPLLFSTFENSKKLCTLQTMIQWRKPTIGCVSALFFYYILFFEKKSDFLKLQVEHYVSRWTSMKKNCLTGRSMTFKMTAFRAETSTRTSYQTPRKFQR